MRIVLAPDSFKASLSAEAAAQAMADLQAGHTVARRERKLAFHTGDAPPKVTRWTVER